MTMHNIAMIDELSSRTKASSWEHEFKWKISKIFESQGKVQKRNKKKYINSRTMMFVCENVKMLVDSETIKRSVYSRKKFISGFILTMNQQSNTFQDPLSHLFIFINYHIVVDIYYQWSRSAKICAICMISLRIASQCFVRCSFTNFSRCTN